MMTGMNPMMSGMNPAMMGGMGGMGRGAMGGMGRGAMGGGDDMGSHQNIPRGPRAAGAQGQPPPTGPGPQRTSRGGGGYHPYSR
jgi:RNA-binding protein Musashi